MIEMVRGCQRRRWHDLNCRRASGSCHAALMLPIRPCSPTSLSVLGAPIHTRVMYDVERGGTQWSQRPRNLAAPLLVQYVCPYNTHPGTGLG